MHRRFDDTPGIYEVCFFISPFYGSFTDEMSLRSNAPSQGGGPIIAKEEAQNVTRFQIRP